MDEQETISVNVETGKRSDDIEVIEQDGVKYIRADQVDEYKANQINEIETIKSELDSTNQAIDEIEQIKAIEERQKVMRDFAKKHGQDFDLSESVDFSNEDEFNGVMDYLEKASTYLYADPSAGFGPSKQPQANGAKQLYEQGKENARKVIEGRR